MEFTWKDFFWRTWEDNRRLTLKVARMFSNEQIFSAVPIPTMRPFAQMLIEIAGMEHFHIHGLAEDKWDWGPYASTHSEITDAEDLFSILQETREYTRNVWNNISEDQLLTPHVAPPHFAGSTAPPLEWLQYALENEIHHRAQGYTYLKSLGIEPPVFWDRT